MKRGSTGTICRHKKSKGGLRTRAWWVMKRLGTFTVGQLLEVVAEKSETGADVNLYAYLNALAKAGIVRVERIGKSNRYTLLKPLGQIAPIWRRASREVYDPNSGEVYSTKKEEADHD